MAAWHCVRSILPKAHSFGIIMPRLMKFKIRSVQRHNFSLVSAVLKDLKYTTDHEWISNEDGVGTIGITNYAQDKLGDVVYVEMPEVDSEFSAGDIVGALESVKAASDLYTPVTGTVTEANENLSDSPGLINTSPYEDGWIIKMKLSNEEELDGLMSEEEYDKFVRELETE